MNIVQGDLIELAESGVFDVIIHGCNCFNTMGSGIARTIRTKYPEAYDADCETVAGDKEKLGTYTSYDTGKFIIINAYTQYNFNCVGSASTDLFNYHAFESILESLEEDFISKRFGFPEIGCGLAGGNKKTIMDLIQTFYENVEPYGSTVTVVQFDK